jgi:hypothetical protein
MAIRFPIHILLAAAVLSAAGCATPPHQNPIPLSQDELDAFLDSGRDARQYNITIYQNAAGPRFEFANRLHPEQAALAKFASPKGTDLPIIRIKLETVPEFKLLIDTSARHSWLLMESAELFEYEVFAPPMGAYPDHVISEIPGYAGVASKLVLDKMNIESPIFYVLPARGRLGPLLRLDPGVRPDLASDRTLWTAGKIHAVMGAALLRPFPFVRFDFPGRSVAYVTSGEYAPPANSRVVARLKMYDWQGRPAIKGLLDGQPITLVIDTAGGFDLSLPGEDVGDPRALVLGGLDVGEIRAATHAERGLPEEFPARLGLGVLARYAVTLDHQNALVWFEEKGAAPAEESAPSTEEETPAPVHYRGVDP